MDNNTQNEQISALDKAKINLEALKNKESKFLFFVADTGNPAASVYEVYRHASVIKKLGYNVTILTDSDEFKKPNWIEPELTDLEHISMSKIKLSVTAADVVVIPEIFSNVMEQTKNLPCIRIGLLQSFDYMVNALLPATDWSSFDIENVITTSNELINLMKEFYGENTFNLQKVSPTIPDYFNYNDELKRPVISIVGRNANEISKIVKLFYSKFPQYSWVSFESMVTDSKPPSPLRRMDYAEKLKNNFAVVWLDRISSFGTLPLEAMACNCITIGLAPDIIPEYLIDENGKQRENTGIWTDDIYAIPILIGDTLTKFLDDSIDDKVFETMSKVVENYRPSVTEKQIEDAYTGFLNKRKETIEEAINSLEKPPVEKVEENK